MSKVKSATFTGDVTIKVNSSGSSAQAMLLGQAPIVVARHRRCRRRGARHGRRKSRRQDGRGGRHDAAGRRPDHPDRRQVGGRPDLARASRARGTSRRRARPAPPSAPPPAPQAGSLGIDPSTWAKSTTVTSRAARWGDGLPRGGHGRHGEDHGRHRQGARQSGLLQGGRQRRRRAEPAQKLRTAPDAREVARRGVGRRSGSTLRRSSCTRARSTPSCGSGAVPARPA